MVFVFVVYLFLFFFSLLRLKEEESRVLRGSWGNNNNNNKGATADDDDDDRDDDWRRSHCTRAAHFVSRGDLSAAGAERGRERERERGSGSQRLPLSSPPSSLLLNAVDEKRQTEGCIVGFADDILNAVSFKQTNKRHRARKHATQRKATPVEKGIERKEKNVEF